MIKWIINEKLNFRILLIYVFLLDLKDILVFLFKRKKMLILYFVLKFFIDEEFII